MSRISSIFLSLCLAGVAISQVIEQAAEGGKQVLASAHTGKTVRQCSCEEQDSCVDEMKGQAAKCFHECWDSADLAKVTNNTDDLKGCFEEKEYVIDEFLTCLHGDMKTCVQDKSGPQIPYTDINKVISAGEKRLGAQAKKFLQTLNTDGHDLVQTALDVGACIKKCFLKQNGAGFCFDKAKCQPKIEEQEAKKTIKKCVREVGWKKEAGEMCECAMNAGVEKVKPYCQILHTAQRNRGGRR
ncbi:hypothetical protein DdX_07935 [Ditylenchus destructor]|uniref:Uncharacterized protein n=1 Tax=Ditylenchus destructor TaxID=166010 RepID=A0AAD4R7P5_9BILA|nr:hypothetical protein DdX_07935 [Ditylenchus destructor]